MNLRTSHSPSRRNLLKGRFKAETHVRPPGALANGVFQDACTRCGDCAEVCPQAIIMCDEDGFPEIDVSAAGCTFCYACSEACTSGAILPALGWEVRAVVDDSCLSVHGVSCRTCEDHCDAHAIRFRLMTAGRAHPEINLIDCTGCGFCVAPCPADAISLQPNALRSSTSKPTASESQECTISVDV